MRGLPQIWESLPQVNMCISTRWSNWSQWTLMYYRKHNVVNCWRTSKVTSCLVSFQVTYLSISDPRSELLQANCRTLAKTAIYNFTTITMFLFYDSHVLAVKHSILQKNAWEPSSEEIFIISIFILSKAGSNVLGVPISYHLKLTDISVHHYQCIEMYGSSNLCTS